MCYRTEFGVELAARMTGNRVRENLNGADFVPMLARTGSHMVATMDVPLAKTSAYGVLDVKYYQGRIAHARGLVEKPRPEVAPSTRAIIGRYILQPSIFERLDALGPGADGELQLTDAINADVANTGVTGFTFAGERFDCGSIQGFVQARTAAFAMDRLELRDEFQDFLTIRSKAQRVAA